MNILVIGNGFDLAHGLPTKYTDFLKFVEVIKQVIEIKNNDDISNIDWRGINQQIEELIKINMGNVRDNIFSQEQIWQELLEDNFWIEYFLQCPMYQKENWIDFESEIKKIIKSLDDDMHLKGNDMDEEMMELSNPYLAEYYSRYIFVIQPVDMVTKECGEESITFRQIRERLLDDLNSLIRALEIYLTDYVEKMKIEVFSPDIKQLSIDKVLSFNYSKTYAKLYDAQNLVEYDYIHGQADIENDIKKNNMVLGIDEYLVAEKRDKQTEFVAFKKFYQRIYKQTNSVYKDWISKIRDEYDNYLEKEIRAEKKENRYALTDIQRTMNLVLAKEIRNSRCEIHNLYIFGHSLDVTDKDVLKELILNNNVHTTIFYLDRDIMGQQITNLIKIIGSDELIKRTGGSKKTIEFRKQQDMAVE